MQLTLSNTGLNCVDPHMQTFFNKYTVSHLYSQGFAFKNSTNRVQKQYLLSMVENPHMWKADLCYT